MIAIFIYYAILTPLGCLGYKFLILCQYFFYTDKKGHKSI